MFQKYNNKALKFAKENNLIGVTGSDAHFATEIGNAGVIIQGDDLREAITRVTCIISAINHLSQI